MFYGSGTVDIFSVSGQLADDVAYARVDAACALTR